LQARPQAEAQEAARARDEIFVGVAPGIRDRVKYTEFIVAQVKVNTFSFEHKLLGNIVITRTNGFQKLVKFRHCLFWHIFCADVNVS
jgi:hypothetical protein